MAFNEIPVYEDNVFYQHPEDNSDDDLNNYPRARQDDQHDYPSARQNDLNNYSRARPHDLNNYSRARQDDLNNCSRARPHDLNNYSRARQDDLNNYSRARPHDMNNYPNARPHDQNNYPRAQLRVYPNYLENVEEIEKEFYPQLGECMSICILIVNICLPGTGTYIMACCSKNYCEWFFTGLLQALLSYFIVGWIWAIYTGIQCVKNSR